MQGYNVIMVFNEKAVSLSQIYNTGFTQEPVGLVYDSSNLYTYVILSLKRSLMTALGMFLGGGMATPKNGKWQRTDGMEMAF